jgi:two-component system sensor histidine kinase KdpD
MNAASLLPWLLASALLGGGAGLAWTLQGLRRAARRALHLARRADALRALSEALRDADDPLQQASHLQQALLALAEPGATAAAQATLLLLKDALPPANDEQAVLRLGPALADADVQAGLWLCLRESVAFGPGTGRHEQQGAWYLPLHRQGGQRASAGAACLALGELPPDAQEVQDLRQHAQALCDLMGQALQRAQATRATRQAREEAQAHKLRNTLLAAISHDYRTPLATILGAASVLEAQADQLSTAQRRRLAASIAAEADQLSRLTDNALQLARLDAPGLALRLDWESAEELVGAVLRRLRARDPGRRVRARVEAGLPLLRCDAVLLVQLLDNLVDNALKHGGDETPVEIRVWQRQGGVVLAVRDRGPGVAPAWRERIFEVFQRGDAAGCRGAGVGLAVCRAIAQAHGGELAYRPRGHGGASFECRLPVGEQPLLSGPASGPAGEALADGVAAR